MDKFSLTMFKQVMGALSHIKDLDNEHQDLIMKELRRIRSKLPPQPRKGCGSCGKKKQEFQKALENKVLVDQKGLNEQNKNTQAVK